MTFTEMPPFAAWRHRDARDGFEVLFARLRSTGGWFDGATCAVEEGVPWAVEYRIDVDATWVTRRADVVARSASGRREVRLETDDIGDWLINGMPASGLRGCVDIDLESSSFTNALPVHRLRLEVGQAVDTPAVYVRAPDLAVERLEQRYVRIADEHSLQRYEYEAPRFDYSGRLVYDSAGLLLEYPGLAERVA